MPRREPTTTLRIHRADDDGPPPVPRARWEIGARTYVLTTYTANEVIAGGAAAGSVPIAAGLWGHLGRD